MKNIKLILLVTAGMFAAFLAVEAFFWIFPEVWRHVAKFSARDKNLYVYVVGESSSRGEPYEPKISFPKIVSYMFADNINGKDIIIINLSQRGTHTEQQYWKLFKSLTFAPKENSLLLIYAGINEYESFLNNNGPRTGFGKLLNKSIVLSKLRSCAFHGDTSDYELYLRKIIELAKSRDMRIVISNLIGNFTEFAPQEDPLFTSKDNRILLEEAGKLERTRRFDEAKKTYLKLLDKNPRSPHVHYCLGRVYRQIKQYDIARSYYYAASDLSTKRPKSSQNTLIRRLSDEYKINFVNTFASFEKNSVNGLVGYNLCGDAHHPNLKGYIVLARGFAGEISKIYKIIPDRPDPGEEEIKSYFEFNGDDVFAVYMHNIKWLLAEASRCVYRKDSINEAVFYLKEAEKNYALHPSREKENMLALSHLMLAAVRRDSREALRQLKNNALFELVTSAAKDQNDFFNSWLAGTLCELDLSDDIVLKLGMDPLSYKRLHDKQKREYAVVQ